MSRKLISTVVGSCRLVSVSCAYSPTPFSDLRDAGWLIIRCIELFLDGVGGIIVGRCDDDDDDDEADRLCRYRIQTRGSP